MTERRELTEADRQRIHEDAMELRRRIMNYEDEPEKKERAAKKPKPKREEKAIKGVGLKYDHKQIIRMYGEGKTAADIAAHLGASHRTIVDALKTAGVWKPTVGRPRSKWCDKGHDQDIYRRADGTTKRGTPSYHCGKCKAEREADYKLEKRRKRYAGIEVYVLCQEDVVVGLFSSFSKARIHARSNDEWEGTEGFWTSGRYWRVQLMRIDRPEEQDND